MEELGYHVREVLMATVLLCDGEVITGTHRTMEFRIPNGTVKWQIFYRVVLGLCTDYEGLHYYVCGPDIRISVTPFNIVHGN